MVQPKQKESLLESISRQAEEYDKRNPIVDFKWVVEEVTPAYNTGGYYDQDIPEERVVVADNFKTKMAANVWMFDHVADKGKHLEIVKYNLREITPRPYRQWERVRG